MFQKDFLGLSYPTANSKAQQEIVLVLGGSTGVGSNAIQLAVQAGYTVVATASPQNFDYVRGLGASHVFDYKSKDVVRDIRKVLRRQKFAGAVAIGANSVPRWLFCDYGPSTSTDHLRISHLWIENPIWGRQNQEHLGQLTYG